MLLYGCVANSYLWLWGYMAIFYMAMGLYGYGAKWGYMGLYGYILQPLNTSPHGPRKAKVVCSLFCIHITRYATISVTRNATRGTYCYQSRGYTFPCQEMLPIFG